MILSERICNLIGFLETEQLSLEQVFVAGIAIGCSDFEGNIEEITHFLKEVEDYEGKDQLLWEMKAKMYIDLFEKANVKRMNKSPVKKVKILELDISKNSPQKVVNKLEETKEENEKSFKYPMNDTSTEESSLGMHDKIEIGNIEQLLTNGPIQKIEITSSPKKNDQLLEHDIDDEPMVNSTKFKKDMVQDVRKKMSDNGINHLIDNKDFQYEEVDAFQEDLSMELVERLKSEELSLALIKKLQAEELSIDLIEKLQAEDQSIATKVVQIGVCEICTDDIRPDNIVLFDKCGHIFHPACVKPYLAKKINANVAKLTCPEVGCSFELLTSEVRTIVGYDEYERYEKAKMKSFFG